MVSFSQVSPPAPFIHLSSPPYVLHVTPISSFAIWSPEWYWVRSTDRWHSVLSRNKYFELLTYCSIIWRVHPSSASCRTGEWPLCGETVILSLVNSKVVIFALAHFTVCCFLLSYWQYEVQQQCLWRKWNSQPREMKVSSPPPILSEWKVNLAPCVCRFFFFTCSDFWA